MKKGDKVAMSEMYLRYYMLVYNKCLSFSNDTDEAGDLTHDIMLKVLENIKSFKGSSRFSTWLYSITFNYCHDYKNKKDKHHFEFLDNIHERLHFHPDDHELRDEYEQKTLSATKILSKIDGDDHQLLTMKYQSKKSIKELQQVYNISASALKMRLMRARERAMNMLKSELVA